MTRKAMLDDLKRSGLTDGDAKKAKLKPLTAKQVDDLTGNYAAGYLIPYFDVDGKPVKDYWRVRYTEDVQGPFGAKKKKPLRYTGPKDAIPRFYFPPDIDWRALAKDPEEPIVITEGEKKAQKACKSGLPGLSVPGVWAWRSKKKGVPAIPDFDTIEWEGREVMLAFDNDLMTNPQVIAALNAFAHELARRGAIPKIVYLPKGKATKGLDDYLLTHTAEQFLKLKSEPYKEAQQLWRLQGRLAFVKKVGAIYDFETKRFYKNRNDLLFAFANAVYLEPKASGEGFKEVNAADKWLKWAQHLEYEDVAYRPGEDEVVDGKINLWPGWGCEPKKGEVTPFLDLIGFVFKDEPDLMPHFLQWLAYPLQFPGEKNYTAYLLHSRSQGIGKSLIGYTMRRIYGDNFVVIDQEALGGSFNGWAVNNQFVLGEEITGSNTRGLADRIKNMVTREQIHVNIKYQPEYDLPDKNNFLLTSNHDDALYLEDSDRRTVVIDTKGPPKPQAFYRRVGRSLDNGGAAHWFDYLLNEVDLSDYDPKEPAPTSAAKQRMIDFSKSDVDMFAREVRDNPDEILRYSPTQVNERDLYDANAIQEFAKKYADRPNVTKVAATKALAKVGIECRRFTHNGATLRLWPLRNTLDWQLRSNKEWGEHNEQHTKLKKF